MTNYRSYRVKVQLECGHITTVKIEYPARVPEEYIKCGTCNCRVAVYAIECREWRAKCMNCIYSRFHGQSEANANLAADRHIAKYPGHSVMVRYYINPATFETIKRFGKYVGGRVKFRIDAPETPRVPVPRRIVEYTDIPPF